MKQSGASAVSGSVSVSVLALALGATGLFVAGFALALITAGRALAADPKPLAEAEVKDVIDNPRVTVRSVVMPPGSQRTRKGARPNDEVVIFCEAAHYQAIDGEGKVTARDRAPGTVLWHAKGEPAPTLANPGGTTVRLFSIALK